MNTIFADYIARIEISSLWSGHKHIVWQLRPDVNVLSGKNGAGKSTILSRMVQQVGSLSASGELHLGARLGVKLDLFPTDAQRIRYDVVRSVDRQMVTSERVTTLAEGQVVTELDWQLYQLQRRYLDFPTEELPAGLSEGDYIRWEISFDEERTKAAREEAAAAAEAKTHFLDLVDELFAETGKRIDRESNELRFFQYEEVLSPYVLSSGEKQMLIILLTTLTQDRQPYALFMDEPEVSLHFDWQKRLISMVRSLNPNVQIILTTHSPAVIMDGWEDCVTEVSEITF